VCSEHAPAAHDDSDGTSIRQKTYHYESFCRQRARGTGTLWSWLKRETVEDALKGARFARVSMTCREPIAADEAEP
jgi:hypothetical protein